MRTASIDIGTNTIRLLICEQSNNGTLEKLYIDRVITRLGEGFSQDKRLITTKAKDRTISALKNFSQTIKDHNVNKIRAVATSVVRESENGSDFVSEADKETGIRVEVISGDEEAELTVFGVLNSISVNTEECIIFDIGGGSTEYVHIQNSEILNLKSINLGVVHLTEEFLTSKIESPKEIAKLSENIEEILDQELVNFKIGQNNKITLVGTAGTPTTLAAIELGLKEYRPEIVNNHILKKTWVSSTIENLLKIPIKDRANILGLEKGREDIIIAGSLILLKTLNKFSAKELTVSDGGVLEGIAYSINQ